LNRFYTSADKRKANPHLIQARKEEVESVDTIIAEEFERPPARNVDP